jgi:hypothetical protein
MKSLRRSSIACVVITMITAPFAFAVAAGATFLLDRPPECPEWLPVAQVDEIRDDRPVMLPVWAPHYDVWERLEDQYAGAVYIWREGVGNDFIILSAFHGKWRVDVRYNSKTDTFQSVCFYDEFGRNGKASSTSKSEDLTVIPWTVIDGVVYVQTQALRPHLR